MKTTYFHHEQVNQRTLPAGLPAKFSNGNYDHLLVEVETHGTIVLKTAFGVITVAVIPHSLDPNAPGYGDKGGCLDIKYHGDEFKTSMIGFKGCRDERVVDADLYSFDLRKEN